MDRWMDGQIDTEQQICTQTARQMDGQTDRHIYRSLDGWNDGQMMGLKTKQMNCGWRDRWIDEQTDIQITIQIDIQMARQIDGLINRKT